MSNYDYFEPTANPDERRELRDFYSEYLEECDAEDMISIANHINSIKGSLEDYCWMDLNDFELDEYFQNWKPSDILRNIERDFNYNDRYFKITNDGYIDSCSYPEFDKYDIDEYLDAIEACNYRDLPNDLQAVSDAFDEYEEACDELEEQEDDE